MASYPLLMPGFGQANLSNCEREQIHFAGSIQPHGALLVVSEPDYLIIQASTNASEFLGYPALVGQSLRSLDGNLLQRIEPHLDGRLHELPIAVRCTIGSPSHNYDCLLHRPPEGGLIVELERAGPTVDVARHVEHALQTILGSTSLRMLCDEVATLFRDLTGYDRVMVYRFDDEGHGEVFSERRKPELEAFLGNRYPASDIPQIARQLYERNRVRVLVDVAYAPVALTPRLSPISGRDLDMSLCFLRSMSPIHLQYLKNMGVGATLVASLVVGGKLWGLVACHHYEPRFIHFEYRAVCELLAEATATRIAALESFVQSQSELIVRRLEQRMVEAVSRDGDWRTALFDNPQSLLQPLNATGVALLFDGQVTSAGDVPGTIRIREIGAWLDKQPRAPVLATAALTLDEPAFADTIATASGLVAAPLSTTPSEYLIWFRPERVRTVTWGGDPLKAVIIGDDPSDLSPRRSFAQWHQLVEGTSDPWTPADMAAARLVGETVADIALQFRSVRMLIAQDQLDNVRKQVRLSDQPVVIADVDGKILLINDAFARMLQTPHPHLQRLEDLSVFFSEALTFRRNLRELLKTQQAWHGEVHLGDDETNARPLLLRADPVLSSPDRALGFILFFTDLTERKAAEAARHRFQNGMIQRHRLTTVRLDSKAALVYQNLLSPIVENAQLAALEITYGTETGRMPDMLKNIKNSTMRTAEVLENLIWHASRADSETNSD